MIQRKIILGTVQMGLNYGVNNTQGKITEAESHAILTSAYASGIRYLDTAEAYGTAHQVIGNFHRANPDKGFNVITKIPAGTEGNLEEKIRHYLDALHVPKLEALMFHAFDTFKKHQDVLPSLELLRKQNLFSSLGVSVYTNAELEALIDEKMVDVIQLPFNLLDNYNLRGDLIALAKKKGKIIHTRSVFLQGLFFKDPADPHRIVQALQSQLMKIRELAERANVSVSALALNYCLQQKDIDQVLIGVDSVAHLHTNLEAAGHTIDIETICEIDAIETNDVKLLNPSLWN